MKISERIKRKTPAFWKKMQKIGIAASTIGGALMASPVELPENINKLSGYLITIGIVIAALSQLTVEDTSEEN